MEEELIDDEREVSPAVIYVHAPHSPGLKTTIEEYFFENGIQVVWHRT